MYIASRLLACTPTVRHYIDGARTGGVTRGVNCHLEFNCPTVQNVLIVVVKVHQLNEIGETPIQHVFMRLTVVRSR